MRNQISEAQKIASGGGSEQEVAEAKIELEVRIHTVGHNTMLRDCKPHSTNLLYRSLKVCKLL